MWARRLIAVAAVLAGLFQTSEAVAGVGPAPHLRLSGRNGDAFTVQVSSRWQLDVSRASITGGRRYAGLGLELLGHPANDGLATLAVRMPDRPSGPAARTSVFGAAGVPMPAGRYLLVLAGDSTIHVDIPLMRAARIGAVKPVGHRMAVFGEASGTPSLDGTGLYNTRVTHRLPPMNDPLVITTTVVSEPNIEHSSDVTECVHDGKSACQASESPTFGTGQLGGAGTMTLFDYWDGADGLRSNQAGWVDEGDYRGSAGGARIYCAFIAISGDNH